MRCITIPEFHKELEAQDVDPHREDLAFICPMCNTVQSARWLIMAGAGDKFEDVEKFLGWNCVGRWTNAGPYRKAGPQHVGCDWTLGGLFRLHTLEVEDPADGKKYPRFEVATKEQAHALRARLVLMEKTVE